MLEYDRLTPVERARAAALVMENPVFVYLIGDEILKCTSLAINHDDPQEREINRISVIWANHFKHRLVQELRTGTKNAA